MYSITRLKTVTAVATLVAATAIFTSAASANPLNPFEALFGPQREPIAAPAYANPQEDATDPRDDLRRQVVNYRTSEAPGTIIIDTPNTYLYLVMGGGKAMRYGIGGTNDPSTIGGHVSSGCIRLVNEDVIDLYNRVHVGAKVVVLPMNLRRAATTTDSIN